MVFKTITFDLTQDIDTIFPYSLDSSPESTICLPLTRPVAVHVAAGVSQIFTAPRLGPASQAEKKGSGELETGLASTGISLRFAGEEVPDQRHLRRFTYRELKLATDSFSDDRILGRGACGTVYKGRLSSRALVAVKSFRAEPERGQEAFVAEVEAGKMVLLRNVVPLIGFCDGKKLKELLLVYAFITNGSLSSHLHSHSESQPVIDWTTRKRIAIGIARHLHDGCFLRIIHRDIKPTNILLDENLEPRIGDFGLARVTDHKQETGCLTQMLESQVKRHHQPGEPSEAHSESITTRVCGTYGYMAPECFLKGKYSPKTDVFAYGMALLELISGCSYRELRSLGRSEGVYHPLDWVKQLAETGQWERIVDRSIRGEHCEAEVGRLIRLSLVSTHFLLVKRPNMLEVLGILEGSNSSSLDTRWQGLQQSWIEFAASDVDDSHLYPEELPGI